MFIIFCIGYIYREMDRNYDDQISFDELFLFLFPDHDEALMREKRRLKTVGERVKSSAILADNEFTGSVRVNKLQNAPAGPTSSSKPYITSSGDENFDGMVEEIHQGKLNEPSNDFIGGASDRVVVPKPISNYLLVDTPGKKEQLEHIVNKPSNEDVSVESLTPAKVQKFNHDVEMTDL